MQTKEEIQEIHEQMQAIIKKKKGDLYPPFAMQVELTLLCPQLGTVPMDKEVHTAYLKSRAKGKEKPDEFKAPLSDEEIEEREARSWTTFYFTEEEVVENGIKTLKRGKPFIFDYMIMGFLKNAANVLKDTPTYGMTAFRARIQEAIEVYPRKILFQGELDKPVQRPLRAQTKQGERVTVVKSDSIKEGSKLVFTIESKYHSKIGPHHIEFLLTRGSKIGLGQFRNARYGSFEYEILAVSETGAKLKYHDFDKKK